MVHLENVSRHKDADVFFMAPIENIRVAEAVYSKGIHLISKLGDGTVGDVVDACKKKPPFNFAPLFLPSQFKRQGIYTHGEENRLRSTDITWLSESEAEQEHTPHHRRGLSDAEGLYRWCGYLAVWERELAAGFNSDGSTSESLGHLNISIWNSGRFRGVSRTHELFRTGVSNLLLAQEFDDDEQSEQAHALKRLGFQYVQKDGCMVAVRERHCDGLTELWASSDNRLAAIIVRVAFRPSLWDADAHTLVVASIHLHNKTASKEDAPWMALLPFLQAAAEHKVDIVGYDLNQAYRRAAQWVPQGSRYYLHDSKDADCVGAWVGRDSALLSDHTRISGKYMVFWPADIGLRLGDHDSHISVKLEISWKRVRKDATNAERRVRQQAARKDRKRAGAAQLASLTEDAPAMHD